MTRAVVLAYHTVGVRCLSVLLAHGLDVPLILTHRDDPKENIWFESVAELAARHGIACLTPDDPNTPEIAARIAAAAPDFLFSFYYRHMLGAPLLAIPRRGAYNLHGSLLPAYRGRVPVNWAVLKGEKQTGATLHTMVEKPDAGLIVAQQAVPILPDDTAFEVFNKVTVAAEIALDGVLPDLINGRALHRPQNLQQGSYFGGRRPEDGRIDWQQSARDIHNLVRAVAPPYPGAFCFVAGRNLAVLRTQHAAAVAGPPALLTQNGRLLARCGDGQCLEILRAEVDGTPLNASNFAAFFADPTPLCDSKPSS